MRTILERLEGVRRTRRGWLACCPAHEDRSPSLSIAEGTGGQPLLHCFGGCSYDEIRDALEGRGLPRRRQRVPVATTRGPFFEALEIARRQPAFREDVLLTYQISDAICARRRAAAVARQAATAAGSSYRAWELLARAAHVETEASAIEAALDEALA